MFGDICCDGRKSTGRVGGWMDGWRREKKAETETF
jgi:hypothetical protein